jgi:hypothetical protein
MSTVREGRRTWHNWSAKSECGQIEKLFKFAPDSSEDQEEHCSTIAGEIAKAFNDTRVMDGKTRIHKAC